MITVELLSSDAGLERRIASILRDGERMVWRRHSSALTRSFDEHGTLTVCDCRDRARTAVDGEIARVRAAIGPHARLIGIVRGPIASSVELVATIGDRAVDVLIDDTESLGDLVRAHLSDQSRTAAAVVALAALERHLPPPVLAIARAIFAAGIDSGSVKQVAARAGEHRGTAARRLNRKSDFTAQETVQLAKATVAVVLLRRTHFSVNEIRRCLGYSKAQYVDGVIHRVFGLSVAEARRDVPAAEIFQWLGDRLAGAHKASLATRADAASRRKARKQDQRTPRQDTWGGARGGGGEPADSTPPPDAS